MSEFKVGDAVYIQDSNRWVESWASGVITKINKAFMEVKTRGRQRRFSPNGSRPYPRNSGSGKVVLRTPETESVAELSNTRYVVRSFLCTTITNKYDVNAAPAELLDPLRKALEEFKAKCPLQRKY